MNAAQSDLDPAAIFACSISLWQACIKAAQDHPELDLSEAYNGYDELMREMMRIGTLFEEWACENVRFEEFKEVWPYFLELNFGDRCLEVLRADQLTEFSAEACLSVALKLGLPLKAITPWSIPKGLEI